MAEHAKTFAEFFAGIGLVHKGLQKGSWQCAYANDIDQKKETMYRDAFGEGGHFHLEDIWNTDAILDSIPGPVLLATASFPCTDLSTAGHYRGLNGTHSSAFFGFAKVIERLSAKGGPQLVMLENVPALLTSHGGEDFAVAARILADLGYFLDGMIVDARHFVPQSRPRLFIFGVTEAVKQSLGLEGHYDGGLWPSSGAQRVSPVRPERLIGCMEKTQLATGWVRLDTPPLPPVQARLHELIDVDDSQAWWPEDQVRKHLDMMSDRHANQVAELRSVPGRHVVPIYRRKRHGQMRAEARFDNIAGCLRTPKGGSARQIIAVIEGDQTRMRWMSAREYARLQGAPEFPINTVESQAIFGFGDAVCVPVIEWIDAHVLSPLAEQILSSGRHVWTKQAI